MHSNSGGFLRAMLCLSAIYSGVGVAREDSVIATIPVRLSPSAVAFAPTNGDMYVVNSGDNTVSVISTSTNKVIETIPVGNSGHQNSIHP